MCLELLSVLLLLLFLLYRISNRCSSSNNLPYKDDDRMTSLTMSWWQLKLSDDW